MDLVYEEIKSDLKINQVVLMLHGYGADAKDFLSLANYWHRFLPNTLFVAPNAPKKCQINSAGYEWFDLVQTDKNKTTNELIESVDKLKIFNYYTTMKNIYTIFLILISITNLTYKFFGR